MRYAPTPLAGLVVVTPRVHQDARGFFMESWSRERYAAAGLDVTFVQDNHSHSVRGTLRGLHYQSTPGQVKLVHVTRGRVFDVAVDIRVDSASFGQHFGIILDDASHQQLFIPVGFAHGFCVLSEVADVVYKVSATYHPDTERGIAFDDPDLAIPWPITSPTLSQRDRHNESFKAYRQRVSG